MQQPPPPPPPIPVPLTVETAKHGNDPIVWEMTYGSNKGGPNNYPVVTVPAKANADFTITINNPGATTFSNDPIWVQKDTKPTKTGVHGIKVDSGAGTTVLKFHDGNMNAERLVYVLNFANVPAGTPAQLDPIIDNQGGGPGLMRESGINYLYVGGAVLLLMVLALILLRRRSAMPQRPAAQRPAAPPPEAQRPTDVPPPTDAPRPTDLDES
jgi:hypothetical protein